MRTLPFIPTLSLAVLALAANAQTYSYNPSSGSSTAFVFGNTMAEHNQQLYQPGQILDSTHAPVQVSRIYLQYGFNFNSQGVTLDSLRLAVGQTQQHNYQLDNTFTHNHFLAAPQVIYTNPGYAIVTAGAERAWFSIDLATPFTYDPAQSLVFDVQFANSSNAAFGIEGTGRFSSNQRTYAGNRTDSTGSSSSSTLPHLGIDVITGIRSVKTITLAAYPSPSSERVTFALPNPLPATAMLISADGRRVELGRQGGWDSWQLPAGLAPGLYQALVSQGEVSYRAAVVVR